MSTNTTFTDTNANAFSDKLLRWELLASRLAPLLADRPHLQPVYDELVRLIARAKAHGGPGRPRKKKVGRVQAPGRGEGGGVSGGRPRALTLRGGRLHQIDFAARTGPGLCAILTESSSWTGPGPRSSPFLNQCRV